MSEQRLLFEKTGRAKYISHLDLMRTFQRAFLRAGITVRHTEGFNPHAFVSIPLPLSVGYSSQCELLEFGLVAGAEREEVPERMNRALPEGIRVLACYDGLRPCKQIYAIDWTITMEYDNGVPQGACQDIDALLRRDSLIVQKKSKKAKSGFTQVDLIPRIYARELTGEAGQIVLHARISAQNPGMNPELILEAIRQECPEAAPDFVRFHRDEIYDSEGQVFR